LPFSPFFRLDDPSAEGDRAAYSLSVEDSAGNSLFAISQSWSCGLLAVGGFDTCSELLPDILSFDILLGPGTTTDIHVLFSAEADALSVPEPIAISTLAAGLLATFGARACRRQRSAASS
jgi:hypothetical protein